MTVVRGQFDQLIAPGARKVYIDSYGELPAIYPSIFNIDTSGRAFEDDLVMTGLGVAVSKPEGEPIAFDRPRFRGRVRYIHTGWGLGYEITREAVEDDLYKAINSQGATNLARSMREAEEISAHSVLNNAFTTTLSYDGQPLISTTHTGIGGLTFQNEPSSAIDLSVAALKAGMEHFMLLENDRGLKMQLAPNKLLVSTLGYFNALEIMGAKFNTTVGTAQGLGEVPNLAADFNLQLQQSPYLTDADAWYLFTPGHTLTFYWRRRPDDESGYEGRTQISWYGVTARWSAGVRDWRHIYGSPGQG